MTNTDKLHYMILPRSILLWILRNVNHPIQGFEHKKNKRGEFISYRDQISQTQYQLMLIASDYCQRQASKQHILEVLSKFKNSSDSDHNQRHC